MILTIFRKFSKSQTGAVEFIESSLILPLLILFLSFLFFISIRTIEKSLSIETIYNNSRTILNQTNTDLNPNTHLNSDLIKEKEDSMNSKFNRLGYEKIKISPKENIFSNTITVKRFNSEISTSKVYEVDMARKIDFISFVFEDFKEVDIKGYSIKSIIENINELKNFSLEKI